MSGKEARPSVLSKAIRSLGWGGTQMGREEEHEEKFFRVRSAPFRHRPEGSGKWSMWSIEGAGKCGR